MDYVIKSHPNVGEKSQKRNQLNGKANNLLHENIKYIYTQYMEICIPRKNNYIVITDNVIPSSGCQKLEFYSKKYPNFHCRQASFILKKGEWYQVGSIYVIKSEIYLSLRLQKSRATRQWIKDRIKEESTKISHAYEKDDQPFLKSRSVECKASDLNKKCLVFLNTDQAIRASASINLTTTKKSTRWDQIDI